MRVKGWILLIGGLSLLGGCTVPEETAPSAPGPELALSVEAQPAMIPADGASRMVVLVDVREGGTPVADSTQIILLHTIGTLGRGVLYTAGGVALDTLLADTTAGRGWLIALSQGQRDSVEILFTPQP